MAEAMNANPNVGINGERSADENAVDAAAGDRSALARAMLAFSDSGNRDEGVGVDQARVDCRLGDPPSWRFPALLCRAAASIALLGGYFAVVHRGRAE